MTDEKQKIYGIILAAGSGSRMKRTKQLLPYKGKPLLSHVVDSARKSNLSNVFAVIGHDAAAIRAQIDFTGVTVIENKDYTKGQSSSLKKGVEALPGNCDGAMFLLGDQPLVDKTIINTLINEFHFTDALIIIPCHKGKRGNPVIIANALFDELKTISQDTGARVLFKKYKNQILKVEINTPDILVDVDTIQDYQNLER